ncbi:MAG: DUF488 domain-containing protein [Christensenellales bacterium]|jgi:uncharacterized protein YeaO (DUF488 family)
MALKLKRVYDPPQESDGLRVLVDRLWPRGLSKEKARLDGWVKALAPSSQLRTWFGHKAENFEAFATLYQAELDADPGAQDAIRQLLIQSKAGTVTLLYGAKDDRVNHAAVLIAYMDGLAKQVDYTD